MSAESISAAAAARLAGKAPSDILDAAKEGDVARIADHLAVDPSRVNFRVEEPFSAQPGPALHIAAREGHTAVCEQLIAGKADVNAKDGLNWTALHCAAQNGHTAVCEQLIANKADVNATVEGEQLAALQRDVHYGRWPSGVESCTALHRAAIAGHTAVCEQLIANKADVNAKTILLGTALHGAAGNGHTAVCELLIENKADVNAQHKCLDTALHFAAGGGHTAVCEQLIANKADVNAKDFEGQFTALHGAAREGHTAVCEQLIAGKADVNAKNRDGNTPLKHAIDQNKPEVVALLRSVGAEE